jgi:hypothetical protein
MKKRKRLGTAQNRTGVTRTLQSESRVITATLQRLVRYDHSMNYGHRQPLHCRYNNLKIVDQLLICVIPLDVCVFSLTR